MAPKTSLPPAAVTAARTSVRRANAALAKAFPGEQGGRQPVHTVYGGAHLFRADTARKLGDLALKSLEANAPDAGALARALNVGDDGGAFRKVYSRLIEKLRHEPVEDLRIDFEDGYGHRSDDEEDGHAVSSAAELARGLRGGTLPPFIGLRVKSFSDEVFARSVRTLDLFLTTLAQQSRGQLPQSFIVTLPKVMAEEQVAAAAKLLGALEKRLKFPPGSVRLELMIETPQVIIDGDGAVPLASLARAGGGRVVGLHLGAYDFTAALDIIATHQTMDHPACDFARTVMKVACAGLGVALADGATNLMPVGPHRAAEGQALTREQLDENREVVQAAWRASYRNIRRGLVQGYYQGWDLHPAQLPVRYAAVYSFFVEGLPQATARLKAFIDKAAQATLVGSTFDDAATGQGLLNFFLRGIACGALTEAEALATGLTVEEIRTRSFLKILEGRTKKRGRGR